MFVFTFGWTVQQQFELCHRHFSYILNWMYFRINYFIQREREGEGEGEGDASLVTDHLKVVQTKVWVQKLFFSETRTQPSKQKEISQSNVFTEFL